MSRTRGLVACIVLCLTLLPGSTAAAGPPFSHGSSGIGDDYFPDDGNGGYDVQHYALDISYDPASGVLTGTATITAVATQNLSRFNLDFDGMTVRAISVNGRTAQWNRVGGELRVTPRDGITSGSMLETIVRYDGIPYLFDEPALGVSGFFRTDDGALVAGQPHGASGWFPVNDHPIDKASYDFRIRVPAGLQAIANGRLVGTSTDGGWTTWTWDAPEPMSSYLATMAIGEFEVDSYRRAGIRYWDALDPDLLVNEVAPRSGTYFARSQPGDAAYKRLATTISVPAAGATLAFWINRSTEDWWDFVAVEAHHPGLDDWTTLPDANGHTTQDGGGLCRYSGVHPFLAHYMTPLPPDASGEVGCDPVGTTGVWNAATGTSDGYEPWSVDLGDFAGGDVELSISYITDESVQFLGLSVDDIVVSTGQASTGFEGGSLAPWTVPGAPEGSPGNTTDWIVSAAEALPSDVGTGIQASFGRQPEFLRFMSGQFGPYPFATSGGIVDDYPDIGFALETQTRPVYSRWFFGDASGNDYVFVHELAHQWFGDSVAVARWEDIWLNEGFATYAEWLWSEHEGSDTPQQIYDWFTTEVSPDDPFWALMIGDPGPDHLFDFPVYGRGALTLQALRMEVGDAAFFQILRRWFSDHEGGNVTTPEFIALAEQISGHDLGALFEAWLFTAGYPVTTAAVPFRASASMLAAAPAAVRSEYQRYGKETGLFTGR